MQIQSSLHDLTRFGQSHLDLPSGRFPGIRRLENFTELFESLAFGFDEEEVNLRFPLSASIGQHHRVCTTLLIQESKMTSMRRTTYRYNLNADPADIHEVQFPSNLGDANADSVRVDDHGNVQEQEVETTALGTSAVLQALHSIEGLQRRPTPSV